MTVSSYIRSRASNAVLSTDEEASISTSINTLVSRIDNHFDTVKERFVFGSYTRDTILLRRMDSGSDIDLIIVFDDPYYQPQTYLDRLRRFVEASYSRSEIKQSSPTIVLELNHIKFELVPVRDPGIGYEIPNGAGGWQITYPNGFNKSLRDKNSENYYMLKPAIRLLKFWNAENGYPFASFALEEGAVYRSYWGCYSVADYLFFLIDQLYGGATQWRRDKVERAKKIVAEVRDLEGLDCPILAEAEVKKLIPE